MVDLPLSQLMTKYGEPHQQTTEEESELLRGEAQELFATVQQLVIKAKELGEGFYAENVHGCAWAVMQGGAKRYTLYAPVSTQEQYSSEVEIRPSLTQKEIDNPPRENELVDIPIRHIAVWATGMAQVQNWVELFDREALTKDAILPRWGGSFRYDDTYDAQEQTKLLRELTPLFTNPDKAGLVFDVITAYDLQLRHPESKLDVLRGGWLPKGDWPILPTLPQNFPPKRGRR